MLAEMDFKIVAGLPLFEGLPHQELTALLAHVQPRNFGKGEMLFLRGDPAACFYVILEGWVKIFRETERGDEAVLGVFTSGESLAEAAAFMNQGYPASGQMVDDARILPILVEPFRRHIEQSPMIAMNMLAAMSKRMHHLVVEVEQLKTASATQRLIDFLLRRCTVNEGSAVVRLPYDKTLLSRRLSMEPESLSRIFAKLRKFGVKTEQNQVVIVDVVALAGERQGMTPLFWAAN